MGDPFFGRTPRTERAAVSSKDAFDDLRGRSRTATTRLEFLPCRFHRSDQFRPALFRQPALEHFHERLLLLKRQPIGGIQNLCELCHDRNLADRQTLGNDDFDGVENDGLRLLEPEFTCLKIFLYALACEPAPAEFFRDSTGCV